MSIINAIILGLVQGVTEFLPISSSGHLVIVSHFLGIDNMFTFDVLLNFGTLIALIVFYRKRIWTILAKIFSGKDFKLAAKVILATIPAVVVGVVFNSQIEMLHGLMWIVVFMLVVIGIPMILFGDANNEADDREIEYSVGWTTASKIGLVQALALFPGVSRSGITILTGIKSNLSVLRAAEFSFMLAIPIITGSCLHTLLLGSGVNFIQNNIGAFVVGNIVSFGVGLLSVGFLIKLISKRGLKDFGWYRIVLAIILTLLLIAGIL